MRLCMCVLRVESSIISLIISQNMHARALLINLIHHIYACMNTCSVQVIKEQLVHLIYIFVVLA